MAIQKQQQSSKKSKRSSKSPKRKVYKVEEDENNSKTSSLSSSLSVTSNEELNSADINANGLNESCELVYLANESSSINEKEHSQQTSHHTTRWSASLLSSSPSSSLSSSPSPSSSLSTSPSLSSLSSTESLDCLESVQEGNNKANSHVDHVRKSKERKDNLSLKVHSYDEGGGGANDHLQPRKRGRPPKARTTISFSTNHNSHSADHINNNNDDEVNIDKNDNTTAATTTIINTTNNISTNDGIETSKSEAMAHEVHTHNLQSTTLDDTDSKSSSSCDDTDCDINFNYVDATTDYSQSTQTCKYHAKLITLINRIVLEYNTSKQINNLNNATGESKSNTATTTTTTTTTATTTINNNNNKTKAVGINISNSSRNKAAKSTRQTSCLLLSHPYAFLAYADVNVYKSLKLLRNKAACVLQTPPCTELVIPIVVGSYAQLINAESKDKSHRWTVYLRGLHNGYPQSVAEHASNVERDNRENSNSCNQSSTHSLDTNNSNTSAINVSCDDYLSQFVEKVVFILDRSFTPHIRVVDHAPFELTEEGWGEFIINIQVHIKPHLCVPTCNRNDLPLASEPTRLPHFKETWEQLLSQQSQQLQQREQQQQEHYSMSLREKLGTRLVSSYAGGTAMRVSSSLLSNAQSPIITVSFPSVKYTNKCKDNVSSNNSSNSSSNNNNNSFSFPISKAVQSSAFPATPVQNNNTTCWRKNVCEEEMIAWMADINRSYNTAVRSSFYKSPYLAPHLAPHLREEYNCEYERLNGNRQSNSSTVDCNHSGNINVSNSSCETENNLFNYAADITKVSSDNRNVEYAESDFVRYGNNVVELNHLLRFSHRPWKSVQIPPVGDIRANTNKVDEVLGYTLVTEPVITERYDEIVIPFEFTQNKERDNEILSLMESLEYTLRVCWRYYLTSIYRSCGRHLRNNSHINGNSTNTNIASHGGHTKNAKSANEVSLPSVYTKHITEPIHTCTIDSSKTRTLNVNTLNGANGLSCWDVLLVAGDALNNDFQWTQAYLRTISHLGQTSSLTDYLLNTSHDNYTSTCDQWQQEEQLLSPQALLHTPYHIKTLSHHPITALEWKIIKYMSKLSDVLSYSLFINTLLTHATEIDYAVIAEREKVLSSNANVDKSETEKKCKSNENKSEPDIHSALSNDKHNNYMMYTLFHDEHKDSGAHSKSYVSGGSTTTSSAKKYNSAHSSKVLLNNNDWSNNAKLGICSPHLLDCELLFQLQQGLQCDIAQLQVELARRQSILTRLHEIIPS